MLIIQTFDTKWFWNASQVSWRGDRVQNQCLGSYVVNVCASYNSSLGSYVCPVPYLCVPLSLPMCALFSTNSYATSWSAWQRLMGGKVGTKAELNLEPRINGWNQDSDRIQIVYRIYVFPRAGLDFELFSQVFYFWGQTMLEERWLAEYNKMGQQSGLKYVLK